MRRAKKKQKQPLHVGGRGFSAAKKLDPDKSSDIDKLLNVWKDNQSAKEIIKTAKEFGIGPERFGSNDEEIAETIGAASFKFSRKDKGYCKPIYAVASMILAQNDLDTAKWLITEMASKTEEKEVKKHLNNISAIMDETKNLGLSTEQLGSKRNHSIADEIVRAATNPKYNYPKNAIALVMLGQKAENMVDILLKNIIPKCSGSELFDLGSIIKGRMHRRVVSMEEAEILLIEIEKRLDRIWMAPDRR